MPRVPSLDTYDTIPTGPNIGQANAPVARVRMPSAPAIEAPLQRIDPRQHTPQYTPGARPALDGRTAAAVEGNYQALARGLGAVADTTATILNDVWDRTNRLMVTEATNEASTIGNTLLRGDGTSQNKGAFGVKGANALPVNRKKPLDEETLEQFDQATSKIAERLKNPAQREAFQLQREELRTRIQGQLTNHIASEYSSWAKEVDTSAVEVAVQEAVANYQNPDVVIKALERVEAHTESLAVAEGLSGDGLTVLTRKAVGGAHLAIIGQALKDGNYGYAEAHLKRYADDMDADNLLKARAAITDRIKTKTVLDFVDQAIGGAVEQQRQSEDGLDMTRVHNITRGAESGDRQNARSPAGAWGVMQVMPDTGPEAAKLAGVAWDPELFARKDDAGRAYNIKLGEAYFEEQLRVFGGDPAKAWAAYNAGPRWVNQAVARAARAEPGTQAGNWRWQLANDERTAKNRRDTENYVASNMKALGGYNGAVGGAARSAAPDLAALDAAARERFRDDPEALQLARTEINRRWTVFEQQKNAAEEERLATAFSHLAGGGSLATLPGGLTSYGKAIPQITSYANTVASGGTVQSDQPLLRTLWGNPSLLVKTDLEGLRDRLAPSDLLALSKQKAQLVEAAQKGDATAYTQVESDKQMVTSRLESLGIVEPTGQARTTKQGKAALATYNRVTKMYQDAITVAEQRLGRKLTPQEKTEALDRLFVEVPTRRDAFFGDVDAAVPLALVGVDPKQEVVIPAAERARIRATLMKRYGREPTESAIRRGYLMRLQLGGA